MEPFLGTTDYIQRFELGVLKFGADDVDRKGFGDDNEY